MEDFLGVIKMFSGNFAPTGWAFCDGQKMSIRDNEALYSVLGNTYGGDGISYFCLPDLRGRTPICAGDGPGLSHYPLGAMGGEEKTTFNPDDLHMDIPALALDDKSKIRIRVADDEGDNAGAVDRGFGQKTVMHPTNTSKAFPYSVNPTFTFNTYLHKETVEFDLHTKKYENPFKGGPNIATVSPYTAVLFIIAIRGIYPPRPRLISETLVEDNTLVEKSALESE